MTTAARNRTRAAKNGSAKPIGDTPPPEVEVQIDIPRIKVRRMVVPIVGTASLITHKWSEKAKRQMLDNMQGKRKIKDIRDPEADFLSSMYRLGEQGKEMPGAVSGCGFPVLGFKGAIVSAGRFFGKDLPMTAIKQFVFLDGVLDDSSQVFLTPILDSEPRMREDPVRLSATSTDLRYRAEFINWRAELAVTYVESKLSQGTVLALIDAAGMGVGVGEWRPEKGGMSGTFALDESRDILG